MFQNLNTLLRTLVLGVLVVIAGWWTLFLKAKVADRDVELARSRGEVEQLSRTLESKDVRIDELTTTIDRKQEEIGSLQRTIAEKNEELDRLGVALELLKISRRIARLRVLSQQETADGVETEVEFVEIGPDGEPVGTPRKILVHGHKVYVETWVVKFDDTFVEEGDALRGTSICLFRRIFGEDDRPTDGTPLDPVGEQPLVYAGEAAPDPLHAKLWERFWDYANDPDAAAALGVRAAHGDAPFIEAHPGATYRVELRSSGELTLRRE